MDHNGHCQHICTDLRFGYKCSCHSGYQLAEDQRSCDGNNGHLTEQYVYDIKFSIKPFCYKPFIICYHNFFGWDFLSMPDLSIRQHTYLVWYLNLVFFWLSAVMHHIINYLKLLWSMIITSITALSIYNMFLPLKTLFTLVSKTNFDICESFRYWWMPGVWQMQSDMY